MLIIAQEIIHISSDNCLNILYLYFMGEKCRFKHIQNVYFRRILESEAIGNFNCWLAEHLRHLYTQLRLLTLISPMVSVGWTSKTWLFCPRICSCIFKSFFVFSKIIKISKNYFTAKIAQCDVKPITLGVDNAWETWWNILIEY